jgi:hypothetical protein
VGVGVCNSPGMPGVASFRAADWLGPSLRVRHSKHLSLPELDLPSLPLHTPLEFLKTQS